MKRIINILIIAFGLLFIYLAVDNKISSVCIMKNLFNIRCPGCGLTRSFLAILHFNFIEAFHYNILGIPLFIGFVLAIIFMIYDIFKNRTKTLSFILKFLEKYNIAIILLLVLSMIINNIRGI